MLITIGPAARTLPSSIRLRRQVVITLDDGTRFYIGVVYPDPNYPGSFRSDSFRNYGNLITVRREDADGVRLWDYNTVDGLAHAVSPGKVFIKALAKWGIPIPRGGSQ
jgi:hypothetical protein